MEILKIGKYHIRPIVVVVPELQERTRFIEGELLKNGIKPDLFWGFSSALSGLKTEHAYEVDNPGSGWKIGSKEVCTWITFYSLWQTMSFLPDQYFLQLEWDAKFHDDWRKKAELAMASVPADFDMLYLGSCCTEDKVKNKIAGNVYSVEWPCCGHAVVIAKKCLRKLLSTQRKVYAPLDLSLIFHTFRQTGMKVYTVLPRIADQFSTDLKP